MFLFRRRSSLNLDISDLSLKAGKLSKRGNDFYLDKIKSVPVPAGYMERGRVLKRPEVAELMRGLLQSVAGDHRRQSIVNTVLPDTDTFVKLIKVERGATDANLNDNIYKEVAHHIPYNIDEIYLDWQKIPGLATKDTEQVLVGVCPKEIVDEYIKVIHLAGFVPQSFEVEALAITRSLFNWRAIRKKSLANRNVIIIDLGAARSSLIFWREQGFYNSDTIEFSVSVPLSGMQINKLIEQKLLVTALQAEQFKIKCGLSDAPECQGVLLQLLRPMLDDLTARIRHAVHFHNTYFEGASIDKIILSGGGASLKGLDVFLAAELGIPVELGNPLINIKNHDSLDYQQALSYCTVIGLGLKDFIK